MIRETKGNLIHMAIDGHVDVLVHGCNCMNTMGAGFAKQISQFFPEAQRIDAKTIKGDPAKLGTFTSVQIGALTVINAYTQYWYGPHLDYDALARVCSSLRPFVGGRRVGMPRLGCGLGGGDWSRVRGIIEKTLGTLDVLVVSL